MEAPFLLLAASGAGVWDDATKGVVSILSPLRSLLTVVTGFAAVAVLVAVVIRFMKGDREGASQLAWLMVGLVFAFVMLSVLGSVSNKF